MQTESQESDAKLLGRYVRVRDMIDKRNRSKAKRSDERNRFTGCLTFTLLTIRDELEDRGLAVPR